ncbi:MAG: glycoside hydrolase family 3 C-terminal domain-containing protein [Oscillospiraceae bacterium]|jgi:beta-glucosidase|nr:glycoside hydrolase family 3 C-terminal domain-containing protein [Oscillospiraceae bacterium]
MSTVYDHTQPLDIRVKELVSQMKLDEKLGLLPAKQEAIPRLNIKAYNVCAEGAHGLLVRSFYDQWPHGNSTVFPQPIGLSNTWDKDLLHRVGDVIGTEARVWYEKEDRLRWLTLWFPTIDMERDPRWGRNEEAYGEDPHLAGKLAAALIRGVQGDHPFYLKAACAPKHFYGNNVEKDRLSTSTNISERIKHEYYLRVFKYAFLEGKAVSIMTAYNEINGIPCIANPENISILRDEWGLSGYIVSDGDDLLQTITHHKYCETPGEAIALAIKAGVDCFPEQKAENVIDAAKQALEKGLLTEDDIDRAVSNTLKTRFRLGQFDPDKECPYTSITEDRLCCDEFSAVALEASHKSVVLLENDGILPLDPEKCGKVLVIGNLAEENLPDWYSGKPPHKVSPLDAIRKTLPKNKVSYVNTNDLCVIFNKNSSGWLREDKGVIYFDGTEESRTVFEEIDWGFNSVSYRNPKTGKYLNLVDDFTLGCTSDHVWGWFTMELFFRDENTGQFLPHSNAFGNRYREEDRAKVDTLATHLRCERITNGLALAVGEAKKCNTVVLVLGNHPLINGRECFDRPAITFPTRWKEMIKKVSEANPNVILSLIAGYPFAFPFEAKYLRATMFTSHGEQDVGTAVADVIFGKYNPGGRLSMTWYLSEKDLPNINNYDIIKSPRTYMYFKKPVQFPFGHGLSYTTFEYSNLEVDKQDDGYEVFCTVKNAGDFDGDEVVQLYATLNGVPVKAPIKTLCGFERINLAKGEDRTVAFFVPHEELKLYDEKKSEFAIEPMSVTFHIGASSDDIRLKTV